VGLSGSLWCQGELVISFLIGLVLVGVRLPPLPSPPPHSLADAYLLEAWAVAVLW
jgi:hypothetical protein